MKYYLFDFDGTLVDSMPTWSKKVLRILDLTQTPYPPDILKHITPLGDLGTARYFADVLGVPWTVEEMFAQMDAYALPKYRDEILLKPGVLSFLQLLKSRGCSLNVLTASPHKMLDDCLKRNGVYDLFDHVWSCDDFSATKSDPEIYRRAVALMGCAPEEAAFFDDNIVAVETARKAGLYTVGVYDPTGEDFRQALMQSAHQYIFSMDGLQPIQCP